MLTVQTLRDIPPNAVLAVRQPDGTFVVYMPGDPLPPAPPAPPAPPSRPQRAVSYDEGNALTVGSDDSPYYDGAGAAGVVAWFSGRQYEVGQSVIAPNGLIAKCREPHLSLSFFDARKWIFPSDDGSTLIDFRQLPDGPVNTVIPVRGLLDYFGVQESKWNAFRVRDGRLEWNDEQSDRPNIYLQAELPSKEGPVQHAWLVLECSEAAESNQAALILFAGPTKWFDGLGSQNRAPIHWTLVGNVNGTLTGNHQMGPYNAPGVTVGPTYQSPRIFPGRALRWDATLCRKTGRMRSFIDGKLVGEYTSEAAIQYMSAFAMLEINGPTWKVFEFGISPNLPAWVGDGSRRGIAIAGNSAFQAGATEALTTTWMLIKTVRLAYDESGAVDISWNLFANCSSGRIEVDLGTATESPTETFPYRLCEATTNARVMFVRSRAGQPGTTETVGIWARLAGSSPAGFLRTNGHGQQLGPRWVPAMLNPAIGAP